MLPNLTGRSPLAASASTLVVAALPDAHTQAKTKVRFSSAFKRAGDARETPDAPQSRLRDDSPITPASRRPPQVMTPMLPLDGASRWIYDPLFCTMKRKRASGNRPGYSHRKGRTLVSSILFKLAGGFALLVGAALVHAQDIQERTIRFGHLNNTDHPTSWGVKKFAELVAAKSGGKITVKEYPSSQLGNELQQQSALQGGVQEMLVASTTSLTGIVKEFGLFDFPFLFSNAKQADAMVDGPLGKMLSAKLADKGVLVLGFFDLGFRNVTNSKRPITKRL